jgi:dephospho-CoA kinase
MLTVGLTGGIGSGKTTIANFFKLLGIPVYNSDIRAKQVVAENPALKQEIIKHFGPDSYLNNQYNTKYISSIVFNNSQKLDLLNSIIHPAVVEDFNNWKNKQNSKYVIKEAAILFESGTYLSCDKIITITAPFEDKIKRIIIRDNSGEEEITRRIKSQLSDEEKVKRSDYTLNNDNYELLIPHILKIHESIIGSTN